MSSGGMAMIVLRLRWRHAWGYLTTASRRRICSISFLVKAGRRRSAIARFQPPLRRRSNRERLAYTR